MFISRKNFKNIKNVFRFSSLSFRKDLYSNIHISHENLEKYVGSNDLHENLSSIENKLVKEESATAIWLYLDLSYAKSL